MRNRSASIILSTLFASMTINGCSGRHDNPAVGTVTDSKEDELEPDGHPESVDFSLQKFDEPEILSKYVIPYESIRIVTLDQKADLADGQFASSVIHLGFVLVDGELLSPSDAIGKFAQSLVWLQLQSVRDGYEERVRMIRGSDSERSASPSRQLTGVYDEFGAEKLELKGFYADQGDAWISEDPDLGFVLIECKGKLRADGGWDKTDGACTLTVPEGSQMGLTVTFHQSLRSEWKPILMKVKAKISSWEQP